MVIMAKFLSTTSLNFYLEELIKKSTKNLILISPYLKINTRLKELLQFKADTDLQIRIVYGKKEMAQSELDWLSEQRHIEVRFCKNLHAKCYMNDSNAIISSLNLYEFSQINNNEMGVLLTRSADPDAFKDAAEEVFRLIRNSELLSLSGNDSEGSESEGLEDETEEGLTKLTTSKLAKKHKLNTAQVLDRLTGLGYLTVNEGRHYLTDKGKGAGGEFRKGWGGFYFLWNSDISLD